MAWVYNKKVRNTFVHHTSCWSWAFIDTVGWRRIKDGAPDGCTNLTILFNVAKANDRNVSVNIDAANLITTAYLL